MNQSATASSELLAARIAGKLTSPSNHVSKAEMTLQIRAALDHMDPRDKELIALRHFEQLSLGEAAQALGIAHTAACNRYVRAVKRLRDVLGEDARLG